MKIQIITNRQGRYSDWGVDVNSINAPMSLDMFEINIIDLDSSDIWRNKSYSNRDIDISSDFKSLKANIMGSTSSLILFALPQNHEFKYNKDHKGTYLSSIQLKDMIAELTGDLFGLIIPMNLCGRISYENSITAINRQKYKSAFVFSNALEETLITAAEGSHKGTTCRSDRLVLTTMNILDSKDMLFGFLYHTGMLRNKESEYPAWLESFSILDDEAQNEVIRRSEDTITHATLAIEEAREKLRSNLAFKSILVSNGDALVANVFKILEEILACDLSEFKDENKEDFLIKSDGVTFIGEIKGVTSNIKSEHISQVEVHYHSYMDRLQETGETESVKQLLIMTPFRTKPLEERAEVHEIQINLAKRNECLIIETQILLQVFEKFRNGELTSDQIKAVFAEKSGLMRLSDFVDTEDSHPTGL